jgi:hypothetical protein
MEIQNTIQRTTNWNEGCDWVDNVAHTLQAIPVLREAVIAHKNKSEVLKKFSNLIDWIEGRHSGDTSGMAVAETPGFAEMLGLFTEYGVVLAERTLEDCAKKYDHF